MKYWRTDNFKRLEKGWYELLAELGFEDAEQRVGDDYYLKEYAQEPLANRTTFRVERDLEYYSILCEKIHETSFSHSVDRFIMQCHAEGWKIANIAVVLKNLGLSRARQSIRYRIRVYEMRWGIKQYSPKQLNRKSQPIAS